MPLSVHARWAAGASAAAVLGLVATTALVGPGHASPSPSEASADFRAAVRPEGVRQHLEALQVIADANGGTRASGTSGYQASVDYVVERLRAAGYAPRVQAFDFPFFQELSPATLEQLTPDPTTYSNPEDFTTMVYSGAGDVTATVEAVDTTATAGSSTSGCEPEDFESFTAGNIALMQRGTCSFATKANNAKAAGATAAIIFNMGVPGAIDSFRGTLGAPNDLPVVGASFALGQDLFDPAGTRVRMVVDTISEIRETYNVHAETSDGSVTRVVQAGAHLDGVISGEGLNDNGSGSAALLEVAEAMADEVPRNRVRFSWWGAEELGLLGSRYYVADLAENHPMTLSRIQMYLNFDMVGSPNYVRFVYDGDNSTYGPEQGAAIGPEGSGAIEDTFTDYFAGEGLASEETPFSGRSDYGPFIAEGIPSGGLFTGAEGVKTAEQAEVYGGQAGVAYDPCYHQDCDDLANVSMAAVDEMSDAMAHAVYVYSVLEKQLLDPKAPVSNALGTGERRAAAHDYDAPGHREARR